MQGDQLSFQASKSLNEIYATQKPAGNTLETETGSSVELDKDLILSAERVEAIGKLFETDKQAAIEMNRALCKLFSIVSRIC